MKRQLAFLLLLLIPLAVSAQPIKYGMLYYNLVTNDGVMTAEVAPHPTDTWNGYSGSISILEYIEYEGAKYSVTAIGNGAFQNQLGLESVKIPQTVTSIGDYAFSGCASLVNMFIPEGVTYIGNGAFSKACLWTVTLPSTLTYIGSNAFQRTSLSTVTIPEGVLTIDDYAFNHCQALTSISIPQSVTYIGSGAFSECERLTSLVLPGSVTAIESETFADCASLSSITIPEVVTSIGAKAFAGCEGLTSVTLPNGLETIGKKAFYGCTGLTTITIPGSVTEIGNDAFNNINFQTIVSLIEEPYNVSLLFSESNYIDAILYVPSGTLDKYKSVWIWKYFENILELDPSGISKIKADQKEDVPIYDLNGRLLSRPQKGINIIKTTDGKTKKVIIK